MKNAFKEPIVKFFAGGTCSRPGCSAKVGYRIKVPKRSDYPGNRWMLRYVCREHKDETIEFLKGLQDAKLP